MLDVQSIDYMKVDTEGHDCTILRGLMRYCRDHPTCWPRSIRFECNQWTPKEEVEDTLVQLATHAGYYVETRTKEDVVLKRAASSSDGILHATYMAYGCGDGCSDVTHQVQKWDAQGLPILCNDEMLGVNPYKAGVGKQLHILERINGALWLRRIMEGSVSEIYSRHSALPSL